MKTFVAKENVLRFAFRGMLPKNGLGRRQLKKWKGYAGEENIIFQSAEPLVGGGCRGLLADATP